MQLCESCFYVQSVDGGPAVERNTAGIPLNLAEPTQTCPAMQCNALRPGALLLALRGRGCSAAMRRGAAAAHVRPLAQAAQGVLQREEEAVRHQQGVPGRLATGNDRAASDEQRHHSSGCSSGSADTFGLFKARPASDVLPNIADGLRGRRCNDAHLKLVPSLATYTLTGAGHL